MTDLVLRFLKGTIDVIVWAPYPGHTMLIVPEALLKVRAELAEEGGVSRLFINLRTKRKPGTLAQVGEKDLVLVLGAVEACDSAISDGVRLQE
jgi:hypothetical protein